MPAYNAATTLARTYAEIDRELIDACLIVDDGSHDETAHIASTLGIETLHHESNRGYGAAQKTAYRYALAELGADIVVMLHPDYQYPPRLVASLRVPYWRDQLSRPLSSRRIDDQFCGKRAVWLWRVDNIRELYPPSLRPCPFCPVSAGRVSVQVHS